MSTITKEQAQKIIEAADEVITALAGTNEDVHPESDSMLRLWDDLNDRYAPPEVVRELARIALASLEAEAVCYLTWHQGFRAPDDCEEYVVEAKPGDKSCDGSPAFPVYTAPPAPVSDSLLSELLAIAKKAADAADECAHAEWSDDSMEHSTAIADWERRAAMLQGAERVSNRDELPDGWVACSERMPEDGDKVLTSFRGGMRTAVCKVVDVLGHKIFVDELTLFNGVPADHWQPLPAAPQQEVK